MENNAGIVNKVYLLSFGIHEENIHKIESIVKKYKCEFVVVNALNKMSKLFAEIGLATFEGSYATYARAFISELIEDCNDKLLYIDSDTVVDGDLSELVNVNMSNPEKAYAAVIGMNQYTLLSKEIELANGNKTYYACGVIMFNLQVWKSKCCTEMITDYIRKNNENFIYADQTVINNVIPENLAMPLHIKYNYWGHMFRGARISYELSRGDFYSKEVIKEAKEKPVIIHYKGLIVHPWLKGNMSSLSDRYQYYKKMSPWKDDVEFSIYYDEVKGEETKEQKKVMKQCRQYLRMPVLGMKTIDVLRILKRKIVGEK